MHIHPLSLFVLFGGGVPPARLLISFSSLFALLLIASFALREHIQQGLLFFLALGLFWCEACVVLFLRQELWV